MDVSQIELQVLQVLGALIGAVILWLLKQALAWFKIRLTADRQALLASAVDKMMTLGVVRADGMIRDRGWDHVDSKNAVINYALPALETKFSDTLEAAGVDLNDPVGRARIVDQMERMWPDIAARLSASPVTAPAPVVPVVMAAPAAV